jgi:hypothetical protein
MNGAAFAAVSHFVGRPMGRDALATYRAIIVRHHFETVTMPCGYWHIAGIKRCQLSCRYRVQSGLANEYTV